LAALPDGRVIEPELPGEVPRYACLEDGVGDAGLGTGGETEASALDDGVVVFEDGGEGGERGGNEIAFFEGYAEGGEAVVLGFYGGVG